SLIMVDYFWQGITQLDAETANGAILDMVEWEKNYFDYYEDTTMVETAAIAENYWRYHTIIRKNPTVRMIKEYIAQGYPVIAPFYGKAIGNPNYSGDGPLYHMMVIKGYKGDKFITNDPGTKRGADYMYDAEHLLSVIHDWNGGDVQNGEPYILILEPRG
ncbi:MAG: C39 family peptidase, partial [Candidatus Komeilibacteria bacterium]|nr:C39 family peptidase [Candidatus Komeilibacteria bacterium]